MKKNIFCAIALVSMTLNYVCAEEINKEVEVTRAYIPKIERATKLRLTPDMSDDSYIEPDIDYSITPLSIETKLDSEIYKPVNLSYREYKPTYPLYVKLGAGLPLQTTADLYATISDKKRGFATGFVNYDGAYADIKNDFGEKLDAKNSHLRLGGRAGLYVGSRTLSAGASYGRNAWSRYASTAVGDKRPLYQNIDFGVRFGDDFNEMYRWNYSIGATADSFWSKSDYKNTTLGANIAVGHTLFEGNVILKGGYISTSGEENYSNNTFNIGAKYEAQGSRWDLSLGVDVVSDKVSFDKDKNAANVAYATDHINSITNSKVSNSSIYLLPEVEIARKLNGEKLIAYISVDGELQRRSFGELSEENPYLTTGLFGAESGVEYDTDLGLKGRLAGGSVGFNTYVGYTVGVNELYWAYVDNYFVANYSNSKNLNFNIDVNYQPNSNLYLEFGFTANKYSEDKAQIYEDCKPAIESRFMGSYKCGKWRFGVDAEMLGARKYSIINATSTIEEGEISSTFDLGVDVEYSLKRDMIFFVNLTNLLNNDLYRWARYREYGVGAMVGVKMQF